MTTGRISAETEARVSSAWPEIIEALAAGELVKNVLARAGLARANIAAFMVANPGARIEWESAREASADAFFDEAMVNARTDYAGADAAHVRTRIDTLKWASRIRNPRLYGEKNTLDVNVKHVDLTAIIRDANARLAAAQQPRLVQGERIVDALPLPPLPAALGDLL
jgi:hypothetical protein